MCEFTDSEKSRATLRLTFTALSKELKNVNPCHQEMF